MTFRVVLPILGSALILTGCLTSRRTRGDLPPEWLAALSTPATTLNAVLGTYRNEAESARAPRDGDDGMTTTWFHYAVFGNNGAPPPKRGDLIVVWATGPGKLVFEMVRMGAVLARKELEVVFEPSTGAVNLPPAMEAGTIAVASRAAQRTVQLFKGSDGRLYARVHRKVLGALLVVPVGAVYEGWQRISPVPAPSP